MALFSPGIPSGVICMWAGTVATIPAGWYLCDGTNGTPNLADQFIVGEVTTPGGTGGTISPTAALTTHSAHVFTQPSAHSAHVFTQPSAHTLGASGAGSSHTHATGGTHTHTLSPALGWAQVNTTTGAVRLRRSTSASISWTSDSGRLFTDTGASLAAETVGAGLDGLTAAANDATSAAEAAHTHAAGTISAHAGGAVDAHSAHAGGAVDAHSAHAIYKYFKMAFIQKA